MPKWRTADQQKLAKRRDTDGAIIARGRCGLHSPISTNLPGAHIPRLRRALLFQAPNNSPVRNNMSWREITALTMGIIVATALTVFATVSLFTVID
jgi:hypothetical protein